ncbi:hypothetical protein Q4519_00215 [Motilimonas sp. 1_MG-2023]|uniref:hypothetical protein n=1 Tax=Motilimonas sp. 1_MG-2023 TaxID=3062672 RepID=UPI0026E242E8|nr:hypothetical protein [Motilimonas sp. 1_MG-2023]MDO6524092.1 hypothetical protein [Motilimonas sp. 1_MG-2023]
MLKTLGVITASLLATSVYAKQVQVPFSGSFADGQPVQGMVSYDDQSQLNFSDQYTHQYVDTSNSSFIEVTLDGQTYRADASMYTPFQLHLYHGMGDGRRDLVIQSQAPLMSANGQNIGAMDIIMSDADGAQFGSSLPSSINLQPVVGPNRFSSGNDWADLHFPSRNPNNVAELSQVGGDAVGDVDKVSYAFEAVVEFANQSPFTEHQLAKGTLSWETDLAKVSTGETDADYEDRTPELTLTVGDYTYTVDPQLEGDVLRVGAHTDGQGKLRGYHFAYHYPLLGQDKFGNPAPVIQYFVLDVYMPNPTITGDLSVPTSLPSLQTPDIDVRIHTMAGGLKVVSLTHQSAYAGPEPKVLINTMLDTPDTNLIVPAKGGKITFMRDVYFIEPPTYSMPVELFFIRYGENITWPNGFVYNKTGSKKVDLFKDGIYGPTSFYVPKHWPAGVYSYNLYTYEVATGAVVTKTVQFTKLN